MRRIRVTIYEEVKPFFILQQLLRMDAILYTNVNGTGYMVYEQNFIDVSEDVEREINRRKFLQEVITDD